MQKSTHLPTVIVGIKALLGNAVVALSGVLKQPLKIVFLSVGVEMNSIHK